MSWYAVCNEPLYDFYPPTESNVAYCGLSTWKIGKRRVQIKNDHGLHVTYQIEKNGIWTNVFVFPPKSVLLSYIFGKEITSDQVSDEENQRVISIYSYRIDMTVEMHGATPEDEWNGKYLYVIVNL